MSERRIEDMFECIHRLEDENAKLTAQVDTAKKYAEAYFDESELLKRENAKLLAANGDLANIIGKLEAEKMSHLRDTNTLIVIRNLLDVDNSVRVEDAVNRLIGLRAA